MGKGVYAVLKLDCVRYCMNQLLKENGCLHLSLVNWSHQIATTAPATIMISLLSFQADQDCPQATYTYEVML